MNNCTVDNTTESKRLAGIKAANLVTNNMIVGLGTGSTVFFAIERIGQRIKSENLNILGIPTSYQTELVAIEHGIPLTSLSVHNQIDIAIDGADQVDPNMNLIKGRGAALLREKIVANASKQFVVVIDPKKKVNCLDTTVPIEVLPFAYGSVIKRLKEIGGNPMLRNGIKKDGPIITDNGNYIIDCTFGLIEKPECLEPEINSIPGIIENGIFSSFKDKTTLIVGN